MKILSRFKQLKKDIKLVIITVLIMSCIGVYATGTCIIAATADDVTYNNTTVSDALNDLYELTQNYCPPGYECRKLKYVTDCDNNKVYTTTPNNLSGLAKIMAENAYLDNGQSEFMTSCYGVNFNAISSDTNGKGIYEIASTKNDNYPIYYYRGDVNNNNVKFGGFCWKAIRTTDKGGVKLIYNGEPDQDGYCTNTTGTSTHIETAYFNNNNNIISVDSPAHVGYMYGTEYSVSSRTSSNLSATYIYGNDVTYSNGTYTLINTMASTGTWATDYNTLNNNHYTCFSTGNTCTSVYYMVYTRYNYGYYLTLKNGKKVEDVLEEMFTNTTDSSAKTTIDTWYNTNLSNYTSYLEDSVYCNDRGISDLVGWNPNGGDTTNDMTFDAFYRWYSTHTPDLSCRRLDSFTVSNLNGNGSLIYPVGLITIDEVMYAGGHGYDKNNKYYIYSGETIWTSSPTSFVYDITNNHLLPEGTTIRNFLQSARVDTTNAIRPVITLKATDVVESGDGTQTNPYVIKTN